MPTPTTAPRRPWPPAETERLRAHYPAAAAANNLRSLLPLFPGRGVQALKTKAHALGLATPYVPWSAAHHALAAAHYPTKGGAYVAGLTGRTVEAVRLYCHKNGIRFIQPERPAPRPAVRHDPRPRAANTLKPLEIKDATTKTSAATPNLSAGKAERKRADKQAAETRAALAIVTAAEVRGLDWTHPARQAYNMAAHLGGPAASKAFHQAMRELPAAPAA